MTETVVMSRCHDSTKISSAPLRNSLNTTLPRPGGHPGTQMVARMRSVEYRVHHVRAPDGRYHVPDPLKLRAPLYDATHPRTNSQVFTGGQQKDQVLHRLIACQLGLVFRRGPVYP